MEQHRVVSWRVYGKPATQGSLTSFPYMKKSGGLGVSTPQSKKVLDWRTVIRDALTERYPDLDGTKPLYEKGVPVDSYVCLYIAKPKSNKDEMPINQRTGDIDKYVRAVYDACTGYIYHDDSQIVALRATKVYAPEEEEGVRIEFSSH